LQILVKAFWLAETDLASVDVHFVVVAHTFRIWRNAFLLMFILRQSLKIWIFCRNPTPENISEKVRNGGK
jgi:hypothetical protein